MKKTILFISMSYSIFASNLWLCMDYINGNPTCDELKIKTSTKDKAIKIAKKRFHNEFGYYDELKDVRCRLFTKNDILKWKKDR